MNSSKTKNVLLGIAFSHYVEKARWALAYYGVPYHDQLVMPGLHISPAKEYMKHMTDEDRKDRRPGQSSTATPIFIVYDSMGANIERVVQGSQKIIQYLSDEYSTPETPSLYTSCGTENIEHVTKLEQDYDADLGVATRVIKYYDVFIVNWWRSAISWMLLGSQYSGVIQSFLWFCMSLKLRSIMIDRLSITVEKYVKSLEITRNTFREASAILEHSAYLGGNSFSAADLTFASLAYPAIGITHEDGYTYKTLPSKMTSSDMEAFQEELRATKAGQHAVKMFAMKKTLDQETQRHSKTS